MSIQEQRELRTIMTHKAKWAENAAANRARAHRWVQELWLDRGVKTGVLVAAGPSLEQSIQEIRGLDRRYHEVVAVDMSYRYLMENGVVPEYVICADSSQKMADMLELPEGLNLPDGARWPTLLLAVNVDPKTGAGWPGPTNWFCLASNIFDRDLGEWMQREHASASRVPSYLVPGGNVSSLGLSFLLGVRAAPKVLLYGHDFCWQDDHRFYCGGVRKDLANERIRSEAEAGTVYAVSDTSGRSVKTNQSLTQFARWYRERMSEYPDVIENRTPVTIL